MKRVARLAVLGGALAAAAPAAAQTFTAQDPVLQRIWQEGMQNSQLEALAQPLLDSIGPRLTGTPNLKAGNDWLVKTYGGWGIAARNEVYGTWKGWQPGYLHVDLLTPRVRTLEAYMLAWSPGTRGPVTGDVVALPDARSPAEFQAWLPQARGKFVLVSFPQPTCRPDDDWERWALASEFEKMKTERAAARAAWDARLKNTGVDSRQLARVLEQAGARGIVSNRWSEGWGVDKIFNAHAQTVPEIDVSCEDYGLLYRLQQHGQHPTLRVDAQARFAGDVPIANTVAEIEGTEKPNEYVLLSAHFDSWHSGSGATDNGTGTLAMLEAARILKAAYPKPKRTIVIGHWAGEEQGLNGSRAFAHDHPEIVQGLQALFNQDNGTGRVEHMSGSGLVGAGASLARWLSRVPTELTDSIHLSLPGMPAGGGSDYASFVCASAPGFSLGSLPWNYFLYTWHTQRDTYDKVVFDEVRRNAVLTAMLAYLASEDPERVARDQRIMPNDRRTGQSQTWPACQDGNRDWTQYTR